MIKFRLRTTWLSKQVEGRRFAEDHEVGHTRTGGPRAHRRRRHRGLGDGLGSSFIKRATVGSRNRGVAFSVGPTRAIPNYPIPNYAVPNYAGPGHGIRERAVRVRAGPLARIVSLAERRSGQ